MATKSKRVSSRVALSKKHPTETVPDFVIGLKTADMRHLIPETKAYDPLREFPRVGGGVNGGPQQAMALR